MKLYEEGDWAVHIDRLNKIRLIHLNHFIDWWYPIECEWCGISTPKRMLQLMRDIELLGNF